MNGFALTFRDDTKSWSPDQVQPVLEGHTDWVRDVAWAPSVGVGRAYLASAGQVSVHPSLFSILAIYQCV